MKLAILAIGRLKAGPELELFDDYAKRARGLGRSRGITDIAVRDFAESKLADAPGRMAAEAALLTDTIPDSAFTVVLDERGRSITSDDFAKLFQRHLDQGTSSLAFLIGGPDGHGADLRKKAGLLLSLGTMTWPHRLARVMLAEQIYRAVTILVKHPYHRI